MCVYDFHLNVLQALQWAQQARSDDINDVGGCVFINKFVHVCCVAVFVYFILFSEIGTNTT